MTLSTEINMYQNKRKKVQFWAHDGPYSTMTINIHDLDLEPNEFVMNRTHEQYCKELNTYMVEKQYIEQTNKTVRSGYAEYSIWRFLQEPESFDFKNFKLNL